jgi:hypothetical protein
MAADMTDIRSPEELAAWVKSQGERVTKLERSVAEKEVTIERMAADFKSAQQTITTLSAQKSAAPDLSGSDRDLAAFIVDGKVVARSFDKGDTRPRARHLPGLLDSKPIHPWQAEFQKAVEDHTLAITAIHGTPALDNADLMVRGCRPTYEAIQAVFRRAPEAIRRAFDSATGTGGDFIPTPLLASPLWQVEEFDPDGLLGLFDETPMTSSSVELPLGTLYPKPYKLTGQTGDNPAAYKTSSVGTDKLTITASGLAVMVFMHEDATEDSIVPALPFIRESMVRSMAIGERLCVVNGDTAASHQDALSTWDPGGIFGDAGDSTDHYLRSWLGLRALSKDQSNSVDRGTFSLSTFATDVAAVQGPRGGRGDLVLLTSFQAHVRKIASMTGVVSASDYGSNAPVVRGEVASIYGVPVILTDAMTSDLAAASGLYASASDTTSGALLFNRRLYRRFVRVGTSVDMQRDIRVGGSYLRARNRRTYVNLAKSGQKTVRFLFNM